ncbi:MAG: AzlD domain-containing protein [Eubacteriales bacterium]
MNNIQLILTIIIIGIGTFLFRFSFIYLYGRFEIPNWIRRAMRYVPPAVLSALIFPAIVIKDEVIWGSPQNPRLIAGVIAIIIAWKTKNLLLTIAAGMGIFWLMLFI